MSKKKLHITHNTKEDILVYGISALIPTTKICWFLNSQNFTQFIRVNDHQLTLKQNDYTYSLFKSTLENQTFYILENKAYANVFSQKFQNFDAFIIANKASSDVLEQITSSLKAHPKIQLIIEINATNKATMDYFRIA